MWNEKVEGEEIEKELYKVTKKLKDSAGNKSIESVYEN